MNKETKKYWLSPKLSYKNWKLICSKFPGSGPTPVQADKVLWEMLRDRQVNVFLEDSDDPIHITTEQFPKNALIIKNYNDKQT